MNVLVLDGGASTEIQDTHGCNINVDPLWSSRLLITNHKLIKETHRSFLENGADIIQTVSYQASIPSLCEHADLSVADAERTLQESVHLAYESIFEFWEDYKKQIEESDSTILADRLKPMVCASIGPYGVQYCSGEEYSGDYIEKVTEQDIVSFQEPRIRALVNAGVDYVALETIPTQREAEIVSRLMRQFPNVKTWVSFQCKDAAHTAHGETFYDAVKSIVKDGRIKYVGVNCCSPTVVTPLLESIQELKWNHSLQLVAYPNNGQIYEKAELGTPGRMLGPSLMSEFGKALPRWIDLGATIIGGCCQTTPNDTRLVREYLKEKYGRKK